MKKILTATLLCSWFGVAHAASFPDTFVTESDASPGGVILSVETHANGTEIGVNAEARAIDALELGAQNTIDPEALFTSGRLLTAVTDEFSPEVIPVRVSTLLLPSTISVVNVAAMSGRRARYGRNGSWSRPDRNYYYYHRCGRYSRCD